MPHIKCPCCGNVGHLHASDVAAWYRDQYPTVEVGALVPGLCGYCFPELTESMPVVIRQPVSHVDLQESQHGVILQVLYRDGEGAIYQVRLSTGDERFFIRAELKPSRSSRESSM